MSIDDNALNALRYNENISPILSSLTEPLLTDFSINTLSYVKIIDDKLLHISNNQKWTELYIKDQLYQLNHYQKHIEKLKSHHSTYFVIWNDHTSTMVQKMHTVGVWHGLSIYKKFDNYLEMWNFATIEENERIIEFYLNDISYLERFIVFFKNKAQEILNINDPKVYLTRNSPIVLLPNAEPINTKLDFLNKTKLKKLNVENNDINVTRREIECLYYLSIGKSVKDIGQILQLSPRTIDTHLEHLKLKLRSSYKTDLIKSFKTYLEEYFKAELI